MSVTDIAQGITPFVVAGLVSLVLLIAFPEIALFLPGLMK